MSERELQDKITFMFYVGLLGSVEPEKGTKIMKMLLEEKKRNPEKAKLIDAILKTHLHRILSLGMPKE